MAEVIYAVDIKVLVSFYLHKKKSILDLKSFVSSHLRFKMATENLQEHTCKGPW